MSTLLASPMLPFMAASPYKAVLAAFRAVTRPCSMELPVKHDAALPQKYPSPLDLVDSPVTDLRLRAASLST